MLWIGQDWNFCTALVSAKKKKCTFGQWQRRYAPAAGEAEQRPESRQDCTCVLHVVPIRIWGHSAGNVVPVPNAARLSNPQLLDLHGQVKNKNISSNSSKWMNFYMCKTEPALFVNIIEHGSGTQCEHFINALSYIEKVGFTRIENLVGPFFHYICP